MCFDIYIFRRTSSVQCPLRYLYLLIDVHGLRIAVRQQSEGSPFTTNTALLVTAKDSLGRWLLEAVDEDAAGHELAADALGTVDILGPDAGA
jgi:hypothetical protein